MQFNTVIIINVIIRVLLDTNRGWAYLN